MGLAGRNSELAFKLAPQILLVSGVAVMIICVLAAALSVRKVMRLEPAIVFQT
jgi:putative ABC transport system permease protein